jgi:hypothetical protein
MLSFAKAPDAKSISTNSTTNPVAALLTSRPNLTVAAAHQK